MYFLSNKHSMVYVSIDIKINIKNSLNKTNMKYLSTNKIYLMNIYQKMYRKTSLKVENIPLNCKHFIKLKKL